MTVNHWVAGSSPARGASSKMPIYNKDNTDPYKLSRTRIENFCRCKKCFYLEEKLGISRPASFPFNLNNAVDELLKEEFDIQLLELQEKWHLSSLEKIFIEEKIYRLSLIHI